jgi:uncharacterized protein YciI
VREAAVRHRGQLERLQAQGRLRVAGAFADGSGFLEIYEAADRLEAEQTARGSALVEEGLATWMLREWKECRFD